MSDLEDRIAHYMAAEDWVEDPEDTAWWASRSTEFREDYLASARKMIGIVAHELAEKIRDMCPMHTNERGICWHGAASEIDPEVE